MRHRTSLALALGLWLAGALPSLAQSETLRTALSALDQATPSLIYFYKNDAPACRQFEDAVNTHQGIAALATAFRWYQVDVVSAANTEIVRQCKVVGTPAVYLLTAGDAAPERLGADLTADALYAAMAKQLRGRNPAQAAARPLKYGNTAASIDPATLAKITAATTDLKAAQQAPPATTATTAAPAASESNEIGKGIDLTDPADQPAAAGRDLLAAHTARIGDKLVFTLQFAGKAEPLVHIFIDSDNSPQTGYQTANLQGADRMIENASLYSHTGKPTDWNWQNATAVTSTPAGNSLTITLPLAQAGLKPGQTIRLAFGTYNESFATLDYLPETAPVEWTIPQ